MICLLKGFVGNLERFGWIGILGFRLWVFGKLVIYYDKMVLMCKFFVFIEFD